MRHHFFFFIFLYLCLLLSSPSLFAQKNSPSQQKSSLEELKLTRLNDGQKEHVKLYQKIAKLRLNYKITYDMASKFIEEPIVDNLPELLRIYELRMKKIPYQITQEIQEQNRPERIKQLNDRRLIYEKIVDLIPKMQKCFEKEDYSYFNVLLGQYALLERDLFKIKTKPVERPWLMLTELIPALKLLNKMPEDNY